MIPTVAELLGVCVSQCLQVVVGGNGILSRGAIDDSTSLDILIADGHVYQFHFRVAVLIGRLLPFLFYLCHPFLWVEFLNSLAYTRRIGCAQFDSA